jgi:hypothetical protein
MVQAIALSGTSNNGNYALSEAVLTRSFQSGK